MSEITKIGPLVGKGIEVKKTHKEASEGAFAEQLFKSAQAVDQAIDKMLQGAQAGNMDAQVNEIGKTIQSVAGIMENLSPDAGEKVHTPAKLVTSRYEKMDPNAKG